MNNKELEKKKVFLRTFGCQMNVRDSEFVAGILTDNGFDISRNIDDADVILFNSCSVRKHAEDRLFANIGQLKDLKKANHSLVIGIIGCTAQAFKNKAIDRAPLVDIVCGPGNEPDLPRLIKSAIRKRCRVIATDKVDTKRAELFPHYRIEKVRALISISEGCDNFCSYCIVPYVRGRERSRRTADILKEAQDLARRGYKEIMLLGQNVNSYGQGSGDRGRASVFRGQGSGNFVRLLGRLNKVEGLDRIRFMTSHPKDAHKELFEAMRDLKKVCHHLHLPLQSGSDRILKLMNRGYSAKKYLKLAGDYKRILPGGSLTTDIIVGFPTETERDFKASCDMVRGIGFDSAYTFKYSPRPMTKAGKLDDDVPEGIKAARLKALNEIQSVTARKRNEPYDGRVVEVLVETVSAKDGLSLGGRTRENKPVVFAGPASFAGRIEKVKIVSVTPYALKGRLVG